MVVTLSAYQRAPIGADQPCEGLSQKCSHNGHDGACLRPVNRSPLSPPPDYCPSLPSSTNNEQLEVLFPHVITSMSQSHSHSTPSTAAPFSKFQVMLDNALKVYNKRTKNDLLLHPLAAQLQICNSASDVLAILQLQVQELDQSRSGSSGEDRWTKWLDPTIHVLLTFSQTAGTVGLVFPRTCAFGDLHAHICFAGIFTRDRDLCRNWCSPFSEYPQYLDVVILTRIVPRQLRAFVQVKTLFWTFLSTLNCFSDVSRCTPKCH